MIIAIAGNKSDMVEKHQVQISECENYAKSIGAVFMLTSAKDGRGIEELFLIVSRKLIEDKKTKGELSVTPKGLELKSSTTSKKDGGCKC
eukprot:TRINITY_DN2318_c0_g1_i1.p1 TRINITY_DN2318_c0_g1~~TRINITY_DN2318_c0_g1_i1.p1  ORF type:complete len:100 (+),score=6.59 TRINITY_DN2318_c0_g1_i1:31-300(+)